MKPSVYIETTIPSYLTAWVSRDLVRAAHQQITREWWDHRNGLDLYSSRLVIHECQAGDSQAAAQRLATLRDIPLLEQGPKVAQLAEALMRGLPLPEKAAADSLHIATAAAHGMEYLLTWSCTYIGDVTLRPQIEAVCRAAGFEPPRICTPEELRTEGLVDDGVLREVRTAREAYARLHKSDVRAIVADLRARDLAGDWPVVRRPPRRPAAIAVPAVPSNEPSKPTGPRLNEGIQTDRKDVEADPLFGPPEKLRIPANGPVAYLGQLNDGTQYMSFVTGAVPDGYRFNTDNEDWRKVKSWIGVLHLFDAQGNHLRSEARHGGYDIEGPDVACDKAWAEVHAMFTPYRAKWLMHCDIFVKPFSIVIDGITHGLVYEAAQSEENGPVYEGVFLKPRDVMFHPPWDRGQWST